jgi:hypothetical protein
MYQRRRPSPLVLVPRQSATPTPTDEPEDGEEGPDSPDSVGTTPGLDSPDTPSPTGFPGEELEEEDDEEEEEADEVEEVEEVEEKEDTDPEINPSAAIPSAEATTTTSSQVQAAPQITGVPSSASSGTPSLSIPAPAENLSSTLTVTVPLPAQTRPPQAGPGGANAGNEPPQKSLADKDPGGMGKGAEAALITFTVLGLCFSTTHPSTANKQQAALH